MGNAVGSSAEVRRFHRHEKSGLMSEGKEKERIDATDGAEGIEEAVRGVDIASVGGGAALHADVGCGFDRGRGGLGGGGGLRFGRAQRLPLLQRLRRP